VGRMYKRFDTAKERCSWLEDVQEIIQLVKQRHEILKLS
jgi:hypothetical protein